jgi:hypothetical protein
MNLLQTPTISPGDLRSAILPLRLVFWGGLLCLLDFKVSETRNGSGWSFDYLNDFLGMLMITWSVFRLAGFDLGGPYDRSMRFVKIIAVIAAVRAFDGHFIYPQGELLILVRHLFGIAVILSLVVFFRSMERLSDAAGLIRAAASWRFTRLLFLWIYVIPLGLLYAAMAVATVAGARFHFNLGPFGLFVLPLFFVPLVHLFMSTSRMKREIGTVTGF